MAVVTSKLVVFQKLPFYSASVTIRFSFGTIVCVNNDASMDPLCIGTWNLTVQSQIYGILLGAVFMAYPPVPVTTVVSYSLP